MPLSSSYLIRVLLAAVAHHAPRARRRRVLLFLILPLILLLPASAFAVGEEIYGDFNQFCIDNFGAAHEPLVYDTFGTTPEFVPSGSWLYTSRNSASVAFETNIPTTSYIRFGPTTAYGDSTAVVERPYYLHLHHLTGLQPGQTYHYQLVAIDERDVLLLSGDMTLQTVALSDAIPVPGSLAGPPYVLATPNTTYILTQDIVSDTRAISIKAAGVFLDLNGHTITYDNGPPKVYDSTWNGYLYSDSSTTGIHYWIWNPGSSTTTITNGTVRQGVNCGSGSIGVGFNPVLTAGGQVNVCGIRMDWAGNGVSGLNCYQGTLSAHHNVVIDKGTVIHNRHEGNKAIWSALISADGVHHNRISRTRHQGIRNNGGGAIADNEVYMDSYDTNSYGIECTQDVARNKIFGTGYMATALAWRFEENWADATIRDNFVHMQGVAPTNRSTEYGTYSSVNGVRLTQYGGDSYRYENVVYEDNVIVIKTREGCNTARGTELFSDANISDVVFRNNVVKVDVQDASTSTASCIVAHGTVNAPLDQLPVIYEDNVLLSNSMHVRFGDSYAVGGNHQLRRNTYRRTSGQTAYHTIQIGYWVCDTFGNRFIDSIVEGGAGLEDNLFVGTGRRDYSVGHSLYIEAERSTGDPIALDSLRLADNTGVNYRVQTDAVGAARLELLEYAYVAPQGAPQATRIAHTGHTFQIDGYEPYVVSPELFAISNNEADPVTIVFTPLGTPPDTTPPSGVTNLAFTSTTQTTATLTWTSVGDDGNSGTATTYDLRRSTSPITAANFASATQISGEPTPKAAGQPETFTVTGLSTGTTYYFALKVADEVPNWSALSNVPSGTTLPPPDTTPPSGVTTLSVPSTTQTTATLTWTAVGDDGNSGTATAYDLRRSTSPITAANFASAAEASGEPTPKAAGQPETFTVTGLSTGTTYYFALKVADEVPNWSALSNVPSGTTLPPPDTTPPSGVTTLSVPSTTQTTATLTWTAVGDDGNGGTATTYDLRYSTAVINAGNWGSALQVTGEPVPKAAGHPETFTVTGLTAGTTYYFALKVADEVPNWSALSNVPSAMTQAEPPPPPPPGDTTPPSGVTNLAVSSTTQTTATLTWTAVGDDGNSGTATTYDLRYSTAAINTGTWGSATQVTGEPAPQAAGQPETFTVTNLTAGTTYYFALKVADEVPNWSVISNVPSAATQEEPPPPPPPVDTVPPAAVTDLVTDAHSQTAIHLTWTAVGDDSTGGTATTYDLRYAQTAVTEANWDQATQATGEPAPDSSGQAQDFTVDGLAPGTTYFFVLKVGDEVPNWSGLSNIASRQTSSPPPPPPPPAPATPGPGAARPQAPKGHRRLPLPRPSTSPRRPGSPTSRSTPWTSSPPPSPGRHRGTTATAAPRPPTTCVTPPPPSKPRLGTMPCRSGTYRHRGRRASRKASASPG